MNKELILCRGIQASGKSTWAKKYCEEHPNFIRINRDDIRSMFAHKWSKEFEELVKNVEYETMSNALHQGFNVIIDDVSNLNDKTIDLINLYIKDYENSTDNTVDIKYQDFFISVEECITRDSFRTKPLGAEVIKKTWNMYRSKILNIENNKEAKRLSKLNENKNKPNCIIVDIDGTIALNLTGRPYWGEGAAEGMLTDTPVSNLLDLIKSYTGKVFFVTGREETIEIRKATEDWLNKYFVNGANCSSYEIFMRPMHNYTSGDLCKYNIVSNNILYKYHVDYVLEDSPKVVQMYRDLGLTVLQPIEGKF